MATSAACTCATCLHVLLGAVCASSLDPADTSSFGLFDAGRLASREPLALQAARDELRAHSPSSIAPRWSPLRTLLAHSLVKECCFSAPCLRTRPPQTEQVPHTSKLSMVFDIPPSSSALAATPTQMSLRGLPRLPSQLSPLPRFALLALRGLPSAALTTPSPLTDEERILHAGLLGVLDPWRPAARSRRTQGRVPLSLSAREPAANKDAAFKRAMLVHAQSASSALTATAPFALAVTTCVLHRWPRTLLLLEGAKETLRSALTNDLSSRVKASLCAGLVLSPSFRDSTVSPPWTTDVSAHYTGWPPWLLFHSKSACSQLLVAAQGSSRLMRVNFSVTRPSPTGRAFQRAMSAHTDSPNPALAAAAPCLHLHHLSRSVDYPYAQQPYTCLLQTPDTPHSARYISLELILSQNPYRANSLAPVRTSIDWSPPRLDVSPLTYTSEITPIPTEIFFPSSRIWLSTLAVCWG
ncbi:hypothetical protein K438DRAFT_1965005 [Mycena galopus ATCC 62051]|nr:hypothetical protein K438DRAFT_1965005 [Mycena galopus ATCC 62051]